MYGAAGESDQEPPARSQKIRSEATSAVPGEAILPRLALQLARSRHRRDLHPSLVERRSGAKLIPLGLTQHCVAVDMISDIQSS